MKKKFFFFAMMSAIALAGTLGLTACSEDKVVEEAPAVEDNPTYDPATGLVKSQFVLNIASNAQTRSGATTVQADGEHFRGIDNTLLFAFKTSGKGFVDATFAAADAASRFDLGMVAAANSLNNDGSNSHRILELAMPTGTDAMLFYGKAIRGTTPDFNEIGKVSYNTTGKTATGFSFDLNPRVGADANRFKYTAELLAAIMTQIISAEGSYTVNTTTFSDWTGSATLSSSWKDLNPTTQARDLTPLEEILYKAFTTLTSYGTEEVRGGSSKAILTTVRDLYAVTTKVVAATATSPYEELARHIAAAINTQITTYFTSVTDSPINGFKGVDGIKTSMGTNWNSNWNAVTDEELADFPVVNFTLPEGSAQLAYNATTNKFTHKTPGTSLLNKATTTDPEAYQFPAELMYYCNSGVRTSNVEKSSSDYPNGVANWDNSSSWGTGWDGTSVISSTRATAMTKNVNYGVAMLKTTVGIKLATGITTLEDNRAALNTGETNQEFDPSAINFTWTGVIVGGQPASVDWQFLPVASSTFDKLVYDNRVTGLAAGTAVPTTVGAESSPNYTLLFDNYVSTTPQNKVRVALQFVNNGDDFWGRDNLIRKGQTFYLVAELDPASKTIASWDSYYQVPPLDATGVSTKTTRVFVQDYMTVAKFKIVNDGTTSSLQNAYVTIPDLRSSQLSFGLSVDLDWRPGLVFEDVLLGGN